MCHHLHAQIVSWLLLVKRRNECNKVQYGKNVHTLFVTGGGGGALGLQMCMYIRIQTNIHIFTLPTTTILEHMVIHTIHLIHQ